MTNQSSERGDDAAEASEEASATSRRRASTPPLWMPLAGSGLELASACGAGLAIGYAVGRWIGGGSLAMVIGMLLGFALGMYRFIRQATTITRRVAEAQAKQFHSTK